MGVKRGRSVVADVWGREVGVVSSTTFANRFSGSQDIVLRYEIVRKLEKHRGCVNTVGFNERGDVLISGSDDTRVVLWDWENGCVNLSFHSGHTNNVFQAKFIPFTNDHTIVTCAADGQVRLAQLAQPSPVQTSLLGTHQGRAHKLAIHPATPHTFFTCAEDGLVQHFDLRTKASTQLFTCHSTFHHRTYMPFLHLNTIAIDPHNPNLFVVGGSDEFTRLYDIRNYNLDASTHFDRPLNYFCPPHLVGDERVGITGLAFSHQSHLLVSYNDEHIYLFTKDMGIGPNPTLSSPLDAHAHAHASDDCHQNPAPQVFKGHRNRQTVKGVGFFGPKSEYVVSGSDCGRIFIWRKKDGELIRVMEADKHVVNCIESHPHSTVLASSGFESDIKIWTPKAKEKATLPPNLDEDDDLSSDDDEDDEDDDEDDSDDDAEVYDYEDCYYFDDGDDLDEDDDYLDDDSDEEGDIVVDDDSGTDNDDNVL